MTGRTLIEMSPGERADMATLVVNALESVAEDAGQRGDLKSARNAIYLACSIKGCGIDASTDMLGAAEILLEQGISYVASLSDRFEDTPADADSDPSPARPTTILH